MSIIDGKYHSTLILDKLKIEVDTLKNKGLNIKLAIIIVGDDLPSKIYVNNKIARANSIGIHTHLIELPYEVEETILLDNIKSLNENNDIDGIIVQLPLPPHINPYVIQNAVSPAKDVDGLNPINIGLLNSGSREGIVPCTPLGCMYLIETCIDNFMGKNAVVIGRSDIVGKPMAALLLRKNATVTICHSYTKDLASITSKADIIISAIGKQKLLTKEYFSKKAIVIDVGITRNTEGAIVGDVDFANVKDYVSHISPVPYGVGPMTIAYLMSNTLIAAKRRRKL